MFALEVVLPEAIGSHVLVDASEYPARPVTAEERR
jgi:hypothetical protein